MPIFRSIFSKYQKKNGSMGKNLTWGCKVKLRRFCQFMKQVEPTSLTQIQDNNKGFTFLIVQMPVFVRTTYPLILSSRDSARCDHKNVPLVIQ